MSQQPEQKAQAVGHIPSGLFIICAKDQNSERIDGFLGSWVQQVSFEPLLISLAVKPGRPASDAIVEGAPFSINVIGEHEKGFLKHFWSGYDPDKNPFSEIEHEITDSGLVKIMGAKSMIGARKKDMYTPGDHNLVIAQVLESHLMEEEAKPMVHIRKSGLSY